MNSINRSHYYSNDLKEEYHSFKRKKSPFKNDKQICIFFLDEFVVGENKKITKKNKFWLKECSYAFYMHLEIFDTFKS